MGTPWPEPAPQIHRLMVFNIWSHSNILKLENFTLKKKKKFSGFSKKGKRKEDLARLSCPLSCTLYSSEPHWSHPPESQKRVKPQLPFILNLPHYSPSTWLFYATFQLSALFGFAPFVLVECTEKAPSESNKGKETIRMARCQVLRNLTKNVSCWYFFFIKQLAGYSLG